MKDKEKETVVSEEENGKKDVPKPEDILVQTRHTLALEGEEISYTVTCGRIVLKKETEKDGEAEGENSRDEPATEGPRDGHDFEDSTQPRGPARRQHGPTVSLSGPTGRGRGARP